MFIFSKLLSFIFFGANLVPKSEVLQTDQNLVQGYINYYALISMLMFIFSKKVSYNFGQILSQNLKFPQLVNWKLEFVENLPQVI